eukprot:2546476-Amphidinium_carterae.2
MDQGDLDEINSLPSPSVMSPRANAWHFKVDSRETFAVPGGRILKHSLHSMAHARAAADMNNGLSQETSAMFRFLASSLDAQLSLWTFVALPLTRCSSPLSPIQESGEPGAPSPSQVTMQWFIARMAWLCFDLQA